MAGFAPGHFAVEQLVLAADGALEQTVAGARLLHRLGSQSVTLHQLFVDGLLVLHKRHLTSRSKAAPKEKEKQLFIAIPSIRLGIDSMAIVLD